MLVEKQAPVIRFKVGDLVKIKTTGQTGKIIGTRDGCWLVEVNGLPLSEHANNLEKKQIILG